MDVRGQVFDYEPRVVIHTTAAIYSSQKAGTFKPSKSQSRQSAKLLSTDTHTSIAQKPKINILLLLLRE